MLTIEEQFSELQDSYAALLCHNESVLDDICQILFEGENTTTGLMVTIDRIKEYVGYDDWLKYSEEVQNIGH